MRATLVPSITGARGLPGAIKFYRHGDAESGPIVGMNFVCPCGCGKVGGVGFGAGGWTWNGDTDTPVISPSIFFEQGQPGEWHGWLGGSDGKRPGEWVQC